jgi:hypothetical protein
MSAFSVDTAFLIAVLAMGLATYATRVSGYLFLRGREEGLGAFFAEVEFARLAINQIGDVKGGGAVALLAFHR